MDSYRATERQNRHLIHLSLQPCNLSSYNGFTLIEVLISLTLLTIILGAIYSSFFVVNRAFDRFDSVSTKYHKARMALDIMRREVEASIFKNEKWTSFVIKDRDRFGRTISEIDFASISLSNNMPVRIVYLVDENEGVLRLLKRETPMMQTSDGFTVELIEDIRGFTVETLFGDKWVKTWDTEITNKLPDVLRITIEFSDGGKEVSLTEYARLMTGKMWLTP